MFVVALSTLSHHNGKFSKPHTTTNKIGIMVAYTIYEFGLTGPEVVLTGAAKIGRAKARVTNRANFMIVSRPI